ncbi:collagen alpha-1(XII) chain-like [Lissotriton helveticus]
MASTSAPRRGEPSPAVLLELRRVRRQAIALGVMTAVWTFIIIVLYRLVEREIFYNPKARSSADIHPNAKSCAGLQQAFQHKDRSFQTSVASLLKPTQCLHPAEKNHILFQKAVTQCDQHNKQGGPGGQDHTCVRHKSGTEDSSSSMGRMLYLRKTLCLRAECSGRKDIKADIVLLARGSFGLFEYEFRLMMSFLEELVRSFHVSRDSVQFSLVMFSIDARLEVPFSKSHNVSGLIDTMRTLKKIYGSIYTGEALSFVKWEVLAESRGARANVPRVLVLITDGWSTDDVTGPALELQSTGMEVFVVGVGDSRLSELETIASPPAATHVFTWKYYEELHQTLPELTESICLRVQYKLKTIQHNLLV